MSSSSAQNSGAPQGLLSTLWGAFWGALFGIFFSRLDAPKHESDDAVQPQDTTTNERQRSQPIVTTRVFIERFPPPTPADESRENRKEGRESKNLWIQGAIAFFAAAYGLISFLQWRDSHNNFIKDERAWLFIDSRQGVGIPTKDAAYAWDAHLKNFGKTPVKNGIAHMEIAFVDKNSAPSFDYRHGFTTQIQVIAPQADNVVRIAVLGSNGQPLILDEPTVNKLMSGESYMASYGRIAYADIFGESHWLRYCYWVAFSNRPGVVNANSCSEYNASGDGVDPQQ